MKIEEKQPEHNLNPENVQTKKEIVLLPQPPTGQQPVIGGSSLESGEISK